MSLHVVLILFLLGKDTSYHYNSTLLIFIGMKNINSVYHENRDKLWLGKVVKAEAKSFGKNSEKQLNIYMFIYRISQDTVG